LIEVIYKSNKNYSISLSILDHSGRITLEEFRAAIKSLKLGIKSDEEIKHLFHQFDTTNNGQIDLNEFLQQLRPPMSERRQKAVSNLFHSMDVNKDGKLTILDLKVKALFSF
jgi:Ca2+-binding EF-hand superfamily protein